MRQKTNVHLFKRKGGKGMCVCVCGGKEENCPPIPKEKGGRKKQNNTISPML